MWFLPLVHTDVRYTLRQLFVSFCGILWGIGRTIVGEIHLDNFPQGLATLWTAMTALCRAYRKVNATEITAFFPAQAQNAVIGAIENVCDVVDIVNGVDDNPFTIDHTSGGIEDTLA